GEVVLAGGRVDADDPELPERPLLGLAVAVGVDERVLDLLLGVAVALALEPPVALRLLEDLAPLLARVNGSLDAWHASLPLPQEPLDDRDVRRRDGLVLTERALALRALPLQVVALHRVPAQQLARPRHLEPLLRRAVRLLL